MKASFSIISTSLIVFLTATLLTTPTRAEKFNIIGSPQSDSVIFESDAKLETVVGTTDNIVGFIDFDPNSPGSVGGLLRVDARTLKTGIEMRDGHMRDRHLETNKYPFIEFKLHTVAGLPAKLAVNVPTPCQVTGDFTCHGVTKTITAAANVTLLERSGEKGPKDLTVTAQFDVLLSDYQVSRPQFLFLKLAEKVSLRVRFVASTANAPVQL